MLKKLKFYFIGFIPGLAIVLFILNQKDASCSYFPNDRVTAETLTKPFVYADNVENTMQLATVNEAFLKDSIIAKGEINFEKSQAQKQPFPEYLLVYPKKNPRFEVYFEKAKDSAVIKSFKILK